MIWLFWIGVAWLAYVFMGYPALFWILGRRFSVRPVPLDDFLPGVSVVIAARNEEKDIEWKVRETLAWNYPPDRLEVLAASDASDDRTDEILRGIDDPRLTFVRMERRSGKNVCLNRLVQMARGDLLLFTDANARIGPECLRKMTRHFADPRVGCISGRTRAPREGGSSAIEEGAAAYHGYERLIGSLESRAGRVLVCDGAIFCMRRSLYRDVCPDLANDLELPVHVRHAGYWVCHEPAAVAEEKDTRAAAESFAQRRRISSQGMLALLKLWPLFDAWHKWQFISRKFLRWLALVPLVAVLAGAIAESHRLFYALVGGAGLSVCAAALAGFLLTRAGIASWRFLSIPFYALLGMIATFSGVTDALLGRRFAVWETPSLSRGPFGPVTARNAGAQKD